MAWLRRSDKINVTTFDIEYIKKNTPIEAVLNQRPKLINGTKKWFLCPIHNEKTPSFVWNTDKHYFHCFGCGKSGSVIDLYMLINGNSFYEAAKILANNRY